MSVTERSATKPSSSLTRRDVIAWLSTLQAKRKDDLLASLLTDEDPHLVVELQQQVLESVHGTSPQSEERRRTAADLLDRAQVLGDARRAKEAEDRETALRAALGFEKDTLLFFYDLREMVGEADQEAVSGIIREEKKHLRRLASML